VCGYLQEVVPCSAAEDSAHALGTTLRAPLARLPAFLPACLPLACLFPPSSTAWLLYDCLQLSITLAEPDYALCGKQWFFTITALYWTGGMVTVSAPKSRPYGTPSCTPRQAQTCLLVKLTARKSCPGSKNLQLQPTQQRRQGFNNACM